MILNWVSALQVHGLFFRCLEKGLSCCAVRAARFPSLLGRSVLRARGDAGCSRCGPGGVIQGAPGGLTCRAGVVSMSVVLFPSPVTCFSVQGKTFGSIAKPLQCSSRFCARCCCVHRGTGSCFITSSFLLVEGNTSLLCPLFCRPPTRHSMPLAGKRGVRGIFGAEQLHGCGFAAWRRSCEPPACSHFKIQLHPGHEHCPSMNNLLRFLCSGGLKHLQGCCEHDSPTQEDEKPLAASFVQQKRSGLDRQVRSGQWIPLVPLCCPSRSDSAT